MSITPEPVLPGQNCELLIEKIAAGGHGLAHIGTLPIFVAGAIPGQRVQARITRKKERYAEAVTTKVVSRSMDQIPARCVHFGTCGGCTWQHIPYQKQILYKEEIVRETLEHVTPVDAPLRASLPGRVLGIIPSPQVFHYRNKIELAFGFDASAGATPDARGRIPLDTTKPVLGFRRPGQIEAVLPLTECHLYDEQLSALLQQAQRFLRETNLPVYNPRTRKGLLRSLLLRRGVQTGEQMVCFFVNARKKQLEPLFQNFVRFGQNPNVTSLLVIEHMGTEPKPDAPGIHALKGPAFIRERLFDLTFELSPFSFFQTNTLAAEKLYQVIAHAADLGGRETVLDCYCGIGSIGQYLSRFCSKVVGVEESAFALQDALKSAGKNKIGNISFYRGTAEHVLGTQLKAGGKYAFDCVILDPPRAGLHPKVIDSVLCHRPEKIVLVSCNISTFARDLGAFLKNGYDLRMVQPVDLFPNTPHVETVAMLVRG